MKSKLAVAAALSAGLIFAAVPAQARWHGHGHWHGGGWGAGVAGFAAGALVGGALASGPYYGDPYYYGGGPYAYEPDYAYGPGDGGPSVGWCEAHYRTYDPNSGTYMGYDGRRHPCP